MDATQKLKEKFPFLSYGIFLEEEYIGIIQNVDDQFVNIYVYNLIPTDELKKKFLDLGETWWWESNRMIPINIFLKSEFKDFKPFLRTFNKKEFEIKFGPSVSLSDIVVRKVKKKQIQLVRKM